AADRALHEARLVCAKLHLARARVLHRPGDVGGDRAHLRVRHQAARTEDLAELADHAHRLGRRDHHVEIDLARLHLLGEVFHADERLPALGDVWHYMPSTISPIERALPATVRIAASRSAAFRSGIFALAISSTCARVILPTLSVCGRGLPDSMPAAFLIST